MYVDHVAMTGAIIDPDHPLFSDEYIQTTRLTFFTSFGSGPRLDRWGRPNFNGPPKRTINILAHLPDSARDQRHTGRDPGVVHAPAYYYGGAVVDWTAAHLGGRALPTRMLWVRIWSALLGTIAVYGAWLLAAQVLSGDRRSLLVGLLVATQPMISYWSGLVSNDIGAIATFSLVLAQLAFMLRSRPSGGQGAVLGLVVAAAVLTKSTALALLPLSAATFVVQALLYRDGRPELRRSARNALLVVAVPMLGWYMWSLAAYGTVTGEVMVQGASTSRGLSGIGSGFGVSDYFLQTRAWLADVYRTGWFHFAAVDAPRGKWVYFAPAFVMGLCSLGALGFAWEHRRSLLSPSSPQLRQAAMCVCACAFLTLPFLRLDLVRASEGSGFFVNAGRFLLPSYAAFAVVGVLGLDWLVSRRAKPAVFTALGGASVVFCWHVWEHHFVWRYYGAGSWTERFHRMSFDRPWFVVPATYWVALLLLALLLAAFGAALLRSRREPTN